MASCIFGSACERDADEATDAAQMRSDSSFVDAEARLDVGSGPADAGRTPDASADAAMIRDAADRPDVHPTRDATFVDAVATPDAVTPEADAESAADAGPPDGGTVAPVTLPSIEFLCVSPLNGEPQPWRLRLRLGYGEVPPGRSACQDSDGGNPDGEFLLTMEWGPEVEETLAAEVSAGLYCHDECEPVAGTVTFTHLDVAALRARGDISHPGPVQGPVASGVFEGVWVETGAPLVAPFEDAEGCVGVIVDERCGDAP